MAFSAQVLVSSSTESGGAFLYQYGPSGGLKFIEYLGRKVTSGRRVSLYLELYRRPFFREVSTPQRNLVPTEASLPTVLTVAYRREALFQPRRAALTARSDMPNSMPTPYVAPLFATTRRSAQILQNARS
jgi:hypothetical protein